MKLLLETGADLGKGRIWSVADMNIIIGAKHGHEAIFSLLLPTT